MIKMCSDCDGLNIEVRNLTDWPVQLDQLDQPMGARVDHSQGHQLAPQSCLQPADGLPLFIGCTHVDKEVHGSSLSLIEQLLHLTTAQDNNMGAGRWFGAVFRPRNESTTTRRQRCSGCNCSEAYFLFMENLCRQQQWLCCGKYSCLVISWETGKHPDRTKTSIPSVRARGRIRSQHVGRIRLTS